MKKVAPSHSSAGISRDGSSNFCRTSVSSKLGVWAAGPRAFTRLQDSNSLSTRPEPRSPLTTQASPKVWENTWRLGGEVTIGNRSKSFWPDPQQTQEFSILVPSTIIG